MNEHRILSRRVLLKTMAAAGAITAAQLKWWEEPLLRPRRAWGAAPVRFQFSVPEPKRNALVESLVQRFNQAQKDVEVKVEFVPQAQARQKLISGIASGNPPDCCQVWDNWVGEFEGMGAWEDLTGKVHDWSGYKDVIPLAWQTVTVKNRILSFPWVVTNDALYWRTDRTKEYGVMPPKDDWTFDDFLAYTKAMTKADKNQYGFGMRGQGTWAVLYATEFMYADGAQVLNKGGKNREGAWKFMSWLMEPEPHFMYSKTLGLLPARKTVADRPEFTKDPALAGFVKSFPFSIVSPYLAHAGWGGKLDSEGVPLFQ